MQHDVSYWAFLKQALKHPSVAYVLGRAALEHRLVEKDFRRRAIEASVSGMDLTFPHLDLPPGQYWQRNFFSILFLSIFEALGMRPGKRRTYGLILHAIRGIVTAADNILDGEDKGAVKLRLNGGATLSHFLLTLLQQRMLHDLIAETAVDESAGRRANTVLLGSLFEIAQEESTEEDDVETVLPPEDVLHDIHSYRGSRLLQLAFVVPEITEPELAGGIGRAKEAVGRIGLALQVLDDITDLREDVVRRNHNVLRSWVVHRGPDGPTTDAALRAVPEDDLAAPERFFPQATREVLALAVDLALQGFELLHELGHVVGRDAARDLIETMFELRGLQHLWVLYDDSVDVPPHLIERSAEA